MPRPATDYAAVTEKLLVAAEDILRNDGPNRLTVTAIADACGMPQSNVYRFFADKNALFVEIGRRWFSEVEKIARKAAEAGQAPPEAFKSFILGMLRVKCARYDADPALFRAYLALGAAHPEIVMHHVSTIRANFDHIGWRLIENADLDSTSAQHVLDSIYDLTAKLRDPRYIVEARDSLNEDRALTMLNIILAGVGL